MMASQNNVLVGCIRKLSAPLDPVASGARPYLPKLKGIRSVVFDVYGTMLISGCGDIGISAAQDRSDALQEVLTSMSLSHKPQAPQAGVELLKKYIAKSHRERRQMGVQHPEVDIRAVWGDVMDELWDQSQISPRMSIGGIERLSVEYECRVNPVSVMPGLQQLLETLRSDRIVLGIVSNAQFFTPLLFQALLNTTVENLGFRHRLCIWSYQALEAKPSRALYESVAERLRSDFNVGPSETLYVGNDMLNDIAGASSVGMRTALFAGDKRSLRIRKEHPMCRGVRPDAVLTDLSQISTILSPN